ncbi:hypothetical protein BDD12DRAFT_485142 [Trichophaea hybrida]|nr:hypothetical protein BDD12DRAFT_485142 [Trichophaea hybrida]
MEYIIHTAAQFAPNLVSHLLGLGIDANIRAGDGASPIHHAAMGENLEAMMALVAAGAKINAETHGGRTAFHIALSIHCPSILVYLLDLSATIPPDVTATEVQATIHSAERRPITNKDKAYRRSELEGLSERIFMIPRERRDFPDIPCNWVRAGASRKEYQCVNGPNAKPYLSFTFQGTQLKRVHFRLYSRGSGRNIWHSHEPYHLFSSWLEAAIIKSGTLAQPATHDSPSRTHSVLPRCIQSNINYGYSSCTSYHSVTWDVRDPTPGIKEWLESVQTDDMIVVYPNARRAAYGTILEAVEMEVYWET